MLSMNEFLDGKNCLSIIDKKHGLLAVISLVLLPVALILSIATTPMIQYLPSGLGVFLEFNIKVVEASSEAASPAKNTTNTADAPRAATRNYVNPIFGVSATY